MMRLKDRLNDAGFGGIWAVGARLYHPAGQRPGHLPLGGRIGQRGRQHRPPPPRNRRGAGRRARRNTPRSSSRWARPPTSPPSIYGTTWDDTTLLEEVKQTNLELERKDGIKRHFRYDWQEVAKYNPDYLAYVEAERERLGENHPLFLTQYRLLPIHGGGGFFSAQQRAQLQGEHARRHRGGGGENLCGGDRPGRGGRKTMRNICSRSNPKRDATVVTIGELDFSACDDVIKEPRIKVVEHYRWTGKKHTELYAQLVDILKNVWRCRRVVVDATGVGQPVASFLTEGAGLAGDAVHLHAEEQERAGVQPAGGGQLRAAEDVHRATARRSIRSSGRRWRKRGASTGPTRR